MREKPNVTLMIQNQSVPKLLSSTIFLLKKKKVRNLVLGEQYFPNFSRKLGKGQRYFIGKGEQNSNLGPPLSYYVISPVLNFLIRKTGVECPLDLP